MKVEFYNEEMPDGMEVEVGGLLLVNGGESVEIDDETEQRFESANGVSLKEHLLRSPHMTVGGKRGKVHYLTDDGDETTDEKAADLEVAPEPTFDTGDDKEGGDN